MGKKKKFWVVSKEAQTSKQSSCQWSRSLEEQPTKNYVPVFISIFVFQLCTPQRPLIINIYWK